MHKIVEKDPKNNDTLAMNVAVPAAVVGIGAPLTNMALDAAGYQDLQVDPVTSMALTGGVNGLIWGMRNWDNKDRKYI